MQATTGNRGGATVERFSWTPTQGTRTHDWDSGSEQRRRWQPLVLKTGRQLPWSPVRAQTLEGLASLDASAPPRAPLLSAARPHHVVGVQRHRRRLAVTSREKKNARVQAGAVPSAPTSSVLAKHRTLPKGGFVNDARTDRLGARLYTAFRKHVVGEEKPYPSAAPRMARDRGVVIAPS